MRFFEFKLPDQSSELYQRLEQELHDLLDAASELPEDDPVRKEVSDYLSSLLDTASVQEDQVADAQKKITIALLKQILPDGPELTAALLKADVLEKKVKKQFKELEKVHQQQGREQEFTIGAEIREKFRSAAEDLANKIAGTLDAMEEAARQEKTIDPTVEIKKAPKVNDVQEDLINLITELFSRPISGAKTYLERDEYAEKILGFMQRCKTGIIQMAELISKGYGNVLDTVSESDKEILMLFKNELLKAKPGKTAGNWGPGELGLAIIGSPVSKAGKGDLIIGKDLKIELKASKEAKSGGRFGSKALNHGINGKPKYERALKSLLKSAGYSDRQISLDNSSANYVGNYKTPDVQKPRSVKPGKEKSIKHLNFGETFVEQALNPKIQGRVSKSETENFLSEVATSCIVDGFVNKELKLKWIKKSANSDGTVNYSQFLLGYSAMLFDLYQRVDDKQQILIFNPVTGAYRVLDGPQDLYTASEAQPGIPHIQFGTTAIEFSDSQQKASPQIGIA